MLPHVDELRPIHNLDSMTELVRALSVHRRAADETKVRLKKVA
jgi:uncharacterized protein with von Willebrand factor type A (vWA) domain